MELAGGAFQHCPDQGTQPPTREGRTRQRLPLQRQVLGTPSPAPIMGFRTYSPGLNRFTTQDMCNGAPRRHGARQRSVAASLGSVQVHLAARDPVRHHLGLRRPFHGLQKRHRLTRPRRSHEYGRWATAAIRRSRRTPASPARHGSPSPLGRSPLDSWWNVGAQPHRRTPILRATRPARRRMHRSSPFPHPSCPLRPSRRRCTKAPHGRPVGLNRNTPAAMGLRAYLVVSCKRVISRCTCWPPTLFGPSSGRSERRRASSRPPSPCTSPRHLRT